MPPTTTARSSPAGTKIDDGFATKIAFTADPNVEFWEKTVQPPGVDGGEPIETETMHSVTWRGRASRSLKTMTPVAVTAAYDPYVYNSIITLINTETSITVHFSNGDTIAFFGYLKSFTPGPIEEGEQPEADIEIVPTNTDPSTGAEAGPVVTAGT